MHRCLVLVACLVAGAASFGAAPAIVVQRLPRKPPSRRLAVPRVCATAEEELDERLPPVGQQLQLFWRLSKPFFEQCEGAKLALALLIGLTLLNSGVAVLFSYVSRDLLNTLAARDLEAFTELIGRFALALALATPVSVWTGDPNPTLTLTLSLSLTLLLNLTVTLTLTLQVLFKFQRGRVSLLWREI